MKYKLRVPHSVTALIRKMHPELKKKVWSSLKMILEKPDQGKELKYELSGLRSFRVSRFRIIYRVRNNVIEIVAIGPRTIIYLETLQILKKQTAHQP